MSAKKRVAVDKFGKAVARQLNARKAHQGLTQSEIEAITGISQSQLSKQLRGYRAITIDELDSMCQALNISIFEILEAAERELGLSGTTSAVFDFRERTKVVVADLGTTSDVEKLSDDEIVARINSGEFKVAAQKRTGPIDESFS